jgi:hypothetical protein
MPGGNTYLAMTSHAPEYARKRSVHSGFMVDVERSVIVLNKVVGVFIGSHNGQPFWLIFPGWS